MLTIGPNHAGPVGRIHLCLFPNTLWCGCLRHIWDWLRFCYDKWCGYEHACHVSWWPLDPDTYKCTHAHTHAHFFARFQDINVCLRRECELLLKVQNHFTLLPWHGYETLAIYTPSDAWYWLGQHCLINKLSLATWLLGTWGVVNVTKELNLKFTFIWEPVSKQTKGRKIRRAV